MISEPTPGTSRTGRTTPLPRPGGHRDHALRAPREVALGNHRFTDSVVGCALHSTLAAGKGYTSIEIKVSCHKAVSARSGQLTVVGTVVKAGSHVVFTEGVVTDASGAAGATATSKLLVFDLPR